MAPKSKSPKKTPLRPSDDWQQEMLDKINYLTEKMESMEAALITVTREKEDLQQKVDSQAHDIAELRNGLNDREQYARNWSMRCLNIPIPAGSESDTKVVMNCVYESLLLPILEGAKSTGTIDSIPKCEALLEMAHILPGKTEAKPVICRFYSRFWRNLVFRHRKAYAPREQPATNSGAGRGGRTARLRFPFYEDLTKATFAKLKYIKQQEGVMAAWTVNGTIKFRIADNETIYRVGNINESFEDIVNSD